MVARSQEKDLDCARDILRYFTRNPQATDTVEGVARWRLLDERVYTDLRRVRRAIEWLVSNRLLVQESVTGSRSFFRLNKREIHKIEHFLQRGTAWSKKDSGRKRKKSHGNQCSDCQHL